MALTGTSESVRLYRISVISGIFVLARVQMLVSSSDLRVASDLRTADACVPMARLQLGPHLFHPRG